MTELRIRQAVRAVLFTPDASVLLCRFEFPTGTVWAVPGGGLDPGEDHITALHRELVEEVGLHDVTLGPHIWDREHIIPFIDGQWDGQRDRYYLVPVTDRFEPRPALSWEQLRDERLHELRWWTPEQIDEAASTGTRFAPGRLGRLVRALAVDGPPTTPLDTGI
ncbi:NUDIX domain-containing protein [Ilumatobacter coccineus]|uniref:Putative hydrolase n=1 Tax=Ilumatobacter coccineus (strain NBRC 103263 / KCTC 29153 / YM16-304) TaxID=1313172 RepID=A0A6C7EF49_ILUCY|nr:NUDIX domain-containing protein [Ilumatobacter coccineus]BAN03248.1 putative hydrolase [Ilumatobacter coccineus YM16-304]